MFLINNYRTFSNFKPLDNDNLQEKAQRKVYTPYDPEKPDVNVPEEDFKRMQASLHKFS